MTDLSIIIISYNTKDLTINCLNSIVNNYEKQLEEGKFEIIVVDNASTDASASVISNFKFQISNFKLIKNKENFGFSKANNIGVKEAKGRYVLFLNSDTVVYPNTLTFMIKFMDENKDTGAATCYVEMPNGKLDDASHRGFPTPWNSFCHFSGLSWIFPKSKIFADYSLGWKDIANTHDIDACAGAFMIVRREAGDQIKWWDEDYFWYGDDLDFCYRLKQNGWKIYFVPTVSILHYKGASGGLKDISKHLTTADKATKKLATKARFEAMRIFYKKHYQNVYPKLLNWLMYKGIVLKEKITRL